MAWVVVVVPWEAGMGLAGPRVLKSSSFFSFSLQGPIDEGSARSRSSRGGPLAPKVENQVVDQVDAQQGWELRSLNRPS